MRIDVWSDLLCPFCHLGRRQLALALEEFEHAEEVSVVWHSFQLDPDAPAEADGSVVDHLAAKYDLDPEEAVRTQERLADEAAAVGLDYRWGRAVGGNSYDAHRVIHLARFQGREEEVTDRLMRAWFTEGRSIGDRDVLLELAVEAGLDTETVRGVLEHDAFGAEVRADRDLAARIGVTAVPTFVLDQKFGVTGAQSVPTMLGALRYAWADQGSVAGGGGCGSGACGCGGGAAVDAGAPGQETSSGPEADEAPRQQAVPAGGCGSGGCGCR